MIKYILAEAKKRLELEKKGNVYVALCPFHFEKTPSFYINPIKNTYHCYGCRVSGDVYKFVREYELSLRKERQYIK